jgi:hypothetical protein
VWEARVIDNRIDNLEDIGLDELRAMPLDSLWLLHENVAVVLTERIDLELSDLRRRLGKPLDELSEYTQ